MNNGKQKLRAGIFGAGLMGFWHAKYLRDAGGVVVAVADRDAGAARRLAARFPGAKAFTDLDAMLREGGLDVMHQCAPMDSHVESASRALEHGVHVLVEKPMTSSAREARQLYEIADRRKMLLCPVHQFVFQRGVQQGRLQLASIGELLHWEATFCSAGAVPEKAQKPDEVVADILPHPLSLIEYFSPGNLQTGAWNVMPTGEGELRAQCSSNGVSHSILISMGGRPTGCELRLIGTKGTLHIDLFHGFCVAEAGNVSKTRKITRPFMHGTRTLLTASVNLMRRIGAGESAYPGLRTLIRDFYASIRLGAEPPVTMEQSLAVAQARDTIIEAMGGRGADR